MPASSGDGAASHGLGATTSPGTIRFGTIIVDLGGIVRFCSQRAAELLQFPAPAAAGKLNFRDVTALLTSPEVRLSENGRSATVQRPDGRIIDIHLEQQPDGGTLLLIEDVTTAQHHEDDQHQAEFEYLSLFNNAVCGIYRDQLDGSPIRANQALVAFNGYQTEAQYRTAIEQIGGNWYIDPERPKLFQHLMATEGEVRDLVSEVYRHKTRERRWITENAWYVRDKTGKPICIEGTIQDATERVQGIAAIEYQANTDSLTGAASRFHFMNALNAIARDVNATCVLFIIDLDNFKDVNDMLGHGAGDTVLKAVASRLKSIARPPAIVARLGGDEFAILMSGSAATMKADTVAAEIIGAMRPPIKIEGHNTVVGASVGVALYPAHASSSEELLNNADVALYQVKSIGKNQVCIFDHAMKQNLQRRKALEDDLREAIPADALELYYQPILDTATLNVHGFEALIRWNHPRRGFLPPSQFIAVAEDAGLMTELGNWTINRACRQVVAMPQHINLSVNVSPNQFHSSGIVDQTRRALDDTGLAAERLTLEVTENVLLSNETVAASVMEQLTRLGVKLALDDFGTGYSSLSYLQRFAFSTVKIDRSFVAGIESKPANAAIIRAIIRLAGDLGMDVVAEGIETEAQASLLRAEGCGFLQGFLYGKPQSFLDVSTGLAMHHLRELLPGKPRETMQTPEHYGAVHKSL